MFRFVRITAVAFALAASLAGAASAQFAGWITGCANNPVGSSQCPAKAVGDFMAELPLGYFAEFGALGMESYAMEDVLRRTGQAISTKQSQGGCDGMDDFIFAVSVWQNKVVLSADVNSIQKQLFTYLEAIMENSLGYVGKGC